MKISHGMNSWNIPARETFGEEQPKRKTMKSFSPHWKA
jgi:hypothetical protein